MKNGFLKVCTLSPALRVADCAYNTQETIAAMQQAAQDGAALAVFPELGLTGYTCSDLFLQQPLLDAAEQGLRDILRASETLELVAVVGFPVRVHSITAPPWSAMGRCSALCRRPICRTTQSSMSCVTSPPHLPKRAASHCAARPSPSARTCCSAAAKCRTYASVWRSARTSGPRCRRAPAMRWPGQRCLPISRQVTKPSARRNTAASSSASNPHAC